MTRPSGARLLVDRQDLGVPRLVGDLVARAPSRLDSVSSGPNEPEVGRVGVVGHHVAQERAQHPGRLRGGRARDLDLAGVVAEVGQVEVAEEQAAVGVGVGAHAPVARRAPGRPARGRSAPVVVEQLLRPVAAHPRLERAEVLGIGRGPRPAAPGGPATCPPPAGRRPRPAPSSPWACAARSSATGAGSPLPPSASALDLGDLVEDARRGWRPWPGAWPRARRPRRSRACGRSPAAGWPARRRRCGPARWGWRSCSR